MPRPPEASIADIRLMLDRLEERFADVSFEDFSEHWELQFAAERALEIISEASRNISAEQKALHPESPWRNVADLGNVMRHRYHTVVPKLIWDVIQDDLGPLRTAVDAISRRIES